MGYTDKELLELIDEVNAIEPYCISIVDTFGSMYQEDLRYVLRLPRYSPAILHTSSRISCSSAMQLSISACIALDCILKPHKTTDIKDEMITAENLKQIVKRVELDENGNVFVELSIE